MADLKWRITIDDRTFRGIENTPHGVLIIRPEIPKGIIKKVTAVLPLQTVENERLFMNGYQTWTYCPEYKTNDRIRGVSHVPKFIMDKFGFDRYGDYHIVNYPNEKGKFHGFSYCYFRNREKYRLIASLDERAGYTVFRYDKSREMLSIERDCSGVEHNGGELRAFDLFFAEGTEDEVFDMWFTAMGIKPRTNKLLAGYSSWYNRYQNITEKSIIADLDGCKTALSDGDLFQVDDGWERYVGDWLESDSDKFPNGMRSVADQIHNAGFLAGLWLAPFVCETNSELFRDHPDWLFMANGEPWKCGGNWSGFYSLDIDNAEVQHYLKTVFHKVLNEWGFDLVKLDFLYGAAPFGTKNESRGGRMIRAMELLREWCGDKLILGCGVPVMPAFGIVDYCRISCDVGLDWDDKWFMRLLHRERISTKQAVENTVFRRQLNGRAYLSDPDVFFLRDENLALTSAQKAKLAQTNALLGGVLLTSDDMSKYTADTLKKYRALLKLRAAKDIKVNTGNGLSISYTLNGKERRLKIL